MNKSRKLEEFKPDIRLVDERGPTRERIDKIWGAIEVGDTGTLTVRQSPIERGVRRGRFTEQQGRAANKLYMHWYRGGLAGSLGSADLGRIFAGDGQFSGMPKTEQEMFHRQRFRSAIRCVDDKMRAAGHKGEDAVKVLYSVVCEDIPLEQAGARIGYLERQRAIVHATVLVKCGLNILIGEWGL